jgi:6-phosphogluconolactonase
MTTALQVHCFPGTTELTAALSARLEGALSPVAGGAPALMLSGGNTPLPAYRAVAARAVRAPPGTQLLYSDDRYVPASSEASNYFQTRGFIEALTLPAAQILRVRTELPLEEAAADYDRRLAALFAQHPSIELGLLGLGADGHTASLFRAADLERARGRLALAVHRPDGRDAVTVTPTVLERVSEIVFVVAGADKQPALAALLAGREDSIAWQAVRRCAHVEVWTEPAAYRRDL